MSKNVRVGMIGAGRIGQLHGEHLAYRVPGVELVAIADVNRAAAEKLADRLKIPTVSEKPSDIFGNPQADAVIICSSTDTHAQFIGEGDWEQEQICGENPHA